MASPRKPVIAVTGASKGIGLAVTSLLLGPKFNANVVALSRTRTPELISLESDSLLAIECDVSDDVALTKAIALGLDKFSYLDGLVLNAGVVEPIGSIGGDTPVDAWRHHFDVNFFSLVTALKAALPALRKSDLGGKVIFVSSGSSVKGQASSGPYNTSKAAMNGLCRTLASEEPDVISVALRPGVVDTEMQSVLRNASAHLDPSDHQLYMDLYKDKKLREPKDSGHVIAALAISAPAKLSGEYVSWDAPQLEAFRLKA